MVGVERTAPSAPVPPEVAELPLLLLPLELLPLLALPPLEPLLFADPAPPSPRGQARAKAARGRMALTKVVWKCILAWWFSIKCEIMQTILSKLWEIRESFWSVIERIMSNTSSDPRL